VTALDRTNIRTAAEADRDAVAAFVGIEHGRGAFVADLGVVDMLIAEDRVWLALSRGRLVGLVAAGEIEGALHVEAFYVSEERRGEGIGRALLEALADFGRAAFFNSVTAFAKVNLHERLLRKAGFAPLDDERLPDDLARASRAAGPGRRSRAFARRL
jgi:GNAT superfamily N-acetyltransferase